MPSCLLTIIAPTSLEETLVDWLLEEPRIDGFSTSEIFGHGARQKGMSLLEQVTGRQRRVQFQVQVDAGTATHLIEQMRNRFSGVGLYYFVTSVQESGRL